MGSKFSYLVKLIGGLWNSWFIYLFPVGKFVELFKIFKILLFWFGGHLRVNESIWVEIESLCIKHLKIKKNLKFKTTKTLKNHLKNIHIKNKTSRTLGIFCKEKRQCYYFSLLYNRPSLSRGHYQSNRFRKWRPNICS